MTGYEKFQMERMQGMRDDVTRAEHALVAPFLLIMDVIKGIIGVVFMILLVLGIWLYNNVGWVISWGPNGMHHRQDVAGGLLLWERERVRDALDEHKTWSLEEIDFRKRAVPPPGEPTIKLHYESDGVMTQYTDGLFATDIDPNSSGYFPALCEEGFRQTKMTLNLNDYHALGPWTGRGDTALVRKSAKMMHALLMGQVMTSEMRARLAHRKNNVALPNRTVHPLFLCDVHPYVQKYSKEISDSSKVKINHAPVVDISYSFQMVVGMCLKESCERSDMTYYVTKTADLFSKEPPLSPNQLKAVAALENLATEAFWIQAAHENGLMDDTLTRQEVTHSKGIAEFLITNASSYQENSGEMISGMVNEMANVAEYNR